MIPAPLLALVRYVIVYACGKAVGHGWDFFNWGPDVTDGVVQIVTMILAAGLTYLGVMASTVRNTIERLKARHKPELIAGAAALPEVHAVHVEPALAAAVNDNKVKAAA